jgi:hypothetical protein
MLYLGHIIQKASALPGEGFNPYTRVTTRLDTGTKRWVRGFKKSWIVSLPMTIYILLGLACCGMGIWAAIEGLISVFGPGGTVATCKCFPCFPALLDVLLIVVCYSFRMSRTGIDLLILASYPATFGPTRKGLITHSAMIYRRLINWYLMFHVPSNSRH